MRCRFDSRACSSSVASSRASRAVTCDQTSGKLMSRHSSLPAPKPRSTMGRGTIGAPTVIQHLRCDGKVRQGTSTRCSASAVRSLGVWAKTRRWGTKSTKIRPPRAHLLNKCSRRLRTRVRIGARGKQHVNGICSSEPSSNHERGSARAGHHVGIEALHRGGDTPVNSAILTERHGVRAECEQRLVGT